MVVLEQRAKIPTRIHDLEASDSQPLRARTSAGGNHKFSARLKRFRPGQPPGSLQGFPSIFQTARVVVLTTGASIGGP